MSLPGFIITSAFLFLLILLLAFIGHRINKKDLKLWKKILEVKSDSPASELYYVKKIRQHARTGTKAFVVNLSSGEETGAWFPRKRVEAGNTLLLEGSFGHGPHHQEDVIYVEQILESAPKRALKNWEDHCSIYNNYCSS